MQLAQQRFAEVRDDMENNMYVQNSHELMRALEASSILDCADMAAHASLYRTESRWGLYHNRVEYERNDDDWFCHTLLTKDSEGRPSSKKQAIRPYIVEIAEDEKGAYDKQRVTATVD
jgi:succinate dehydrogenase/fumarate reductase flavoprotein subunit